MGRAGGRPKALDLQSPSLSTSLQCDHPTSL